MNKYPLLSKLLEDGHKITLYFEADLYHDYYYSIDDKEFNIWEDDPLIKEIFEAEVENDDLIWEWIKEYPWGGTQKVIGIKNAL